MKEKACKECHAIVEGEVCVVCNAPTSSDWSGYLIIIDPSNSKIAQKMGIKVPGKYALKVR
ncbi:DNA-directed RNA polymerase subunit E'' [Methanosarcinales archaeon]|jgi:DNA-directed RNA polymerase subunit E"|nr:MAG: DNA-directed RNA polymerase subunit E'' [Methanosarcinales archaeon]